MLQRIEHANGVMTWQSTLLREAGVMHAFSTRRGGKSTGQFASLNLGNPSGCEHPDAEDHIRENYRRLQEAIGATHMPARGSDRYMGDPSNCWSASRKANTARRSRPRYATGFQDRFRRMRLYPPCRMYCSRFVSRIACRFFCVAGRAARRGGTCRMARRGGEHCRQNCPRAA